jgi:hypothetical protein
VAFETAEPWHSKRRSRGIRNGGAVAFDSQAFKRLDGARKVIAESWSDDFGSAIPFL